MDQAIDLPVGLEFIVWSIGPATGMGGRGEELPLHEDVVRFCRMAEMVGGGSEYFVHGSSLVREKGSWGAEETIRRHCTGADNPGDEDRAAWIAVA
jgi:hypothetical protein